MSGGNLYLREEVEPGVVINYQLNRVLHATKSKFQNVEVVDIAAFGKTLVIDGLLQSCEVDEHIYHESLVHPAMLAHATGAKRVFIGGGGEGSTAREVLKHKSVEECIMVDIDGDVVDFCKDVLTVNEGAFADPRLKVIIDCAKKQMGAQKDGSLDVIIMDLDDPLEGGPCYQLYTREFYEQCKLKLAPGGVFVTQSGAAGNRSHSLVFSPINATLRAAFGQNSVLAYNQHVHSFYDEWGWNMAAGRRLGEEEVDSLIEERICGGADALKFLDSISYCGLFALTKQHRATLKAERRVMTDGAHCFMHNAGVDTVAQK